ncbi:MAG: FAD-dependent oxidoreductase [Verrucomicrobia bacterium]|nr:FAD-dependent oxidoreductase [Verrucomicrobiota bacterium]
MKETDVLVVGGGPAGRLIVHALHAAKADLSVTLIKDEEINVNRCAVPYGISDEKPEKKFLIPNSLVTDFGAELIIDRVQHIDTAGQSVTTEKGTSISYSHLVLATGSKPAIPSLPGINAENITPVRSRGDMVRLREWAGQHRRCVVVGGGYIGIEVAAILTELGIHVTLVEMLPHILLATTEEEFAVTVEDKLKEHDIDVRTGVAVSEFVTEEGVVQAVRLEDDTVIETDFVVLSIGVSPNTEIAEEAGLQTSRFGVDVDEYLRTNAPGVYASGDCATKKSFVTGRPARGEFGTNAVFMSRVVAANILGRNEIFPGVINASASAVFGTSFGSAGLIEEAAVREGFDVVCGSSEVMDRYPMIDGVAMIKTKLVFERTSRRLIGGSILRPGHGVAANVDFLSLAIQKGVTIDDLLIHQYATHPELAAKPSDNAFVFATRDATAKL